MKRSTRPKCTNCSHGEMTLITCIGKDGAVFYRQWKCAGCNARRQPEQPIASIGAIFEEHLESLVI